MRKMVEEEVGWKRERELERSWRRLGWSGKEKEKRKKFKGRVKRRDRERQEEKGGRERGKGILEIIKGIVPISDVLYCSFLHPGMPLNGWHRMWRNLVIEHRKKHYLLAQRFVN